MDENFRTYTKVVGVTKLNEDGEDIQDILATLTEDDYVFFIRDYFNEHDTNAYAVYTEDHHIGYLKSELAANIAAFADANPEYELDGVITEITGGGDLSYGCNIEIWFRKLTVEQLERKFVRLRTTLDIVQKREKQTVQSDKSNTVVYRGGYAVPQSNVARSKTPQLSEAEKEKAIRNIKQFGIVRYLAIAIMVLGLIISSVNIVACGVFVILAIVMFTVASVNVKKNEDKLRH